MLQPRRRKILHVILAILTIITTVQGLDSINTSPRRRRQDSNDVTTVLLVDNHGRSSFGRFLSVKPDLGLITSTARTFIQAGVTTEYATQVLGTTLDNGRLYAHLLTKSSRVLYDGDSPSSSSKSHDGPNKKWNIDQNLIADKNFVKNTDFISPNHVEPVLVFPTVKPSQIALNQKLQQSEEEILEEEPSNNPRIRYEDSVPVQNNNIKIFKINPQMKDLTQDNIIVHKETPQKEKPKIQDEFDPSKVKPWTNLPTFTVRNEFSPSGFSYLGDFPDFDINTEKSKQTTVAERKAKLLFRAGLVKPESRDLETITYSGFADFTTTVGDTVIVFTPHTTSVQKLNPTTRLQVQPTIKPTASFRPIFPSVGTKIKTFLTQEPEMETRTVEGHKLDMKSSLPTMVIDKSDRQRNPKQEENEQSVDMDAKSSVLAHEQQIDGITSVKTGSTIIFTPDLIQPSESQIPMLSTPSDEDIAKIFAALQAQAKKPTETLNTPATVFLDETSLPSSSESKPTQVSAGATTIFFDDDLPIENTGVFDRPSSSSTTTTTTTTEKETTTSEKITEAPTTTTSTTTEKKEEVTTLKEETTTELETTTSALETTTQNEVATTPELVSNELDTEKAPEIDVVCTEGSQILPTTTYKTLTYLTTFFIPEDDGGTSTSVKSNLVTSSEIGFETKSCQDSITPSSVGISEVVPTILTTTEREKLTTTEELPTTTEVITSTEDTTTEELTTAEGTTVSVAETTNAPQEITTERRHVTESEPETTEVTTESGEEVEVIYKTLYTTYTYLTTFFQESTSSIDSKIVVTTNVITSTLVPGSEASDSAVAGLFEQDSSATIKSSRTISFEDFAEISPTKSVEELQTKPPGGDGTPTLDDEQVLLNGVKTYYTTYTYFTTIFVDGETEISSRTEVYTNFVTPSIQATGTVDEIEPTDIVETEESKDSKKKILSLNVTPLKVYNSTIVRKPTENKDKLDNDILATSSKEQSYVTLHRGSSSSTEETPQLVENNLLNLNDYETISTMVTDVRSSTSEGDRRIIDNVDKRNVLDDQIVSESNNDSEIIPSPTLLLQTSYTTFTYFTTMYHGTTSSNVVSRLETVTNVVTETLTPTHTLSAEDLNLPVTYFTTYTYWTTLYKDGTTKVTSREETVSNIVTPTPSLPSDLPTIRITASTSVKEEEVKPSVSESIQPSTVGEDDLTTYFTTYTYYTTSYVGNSTVLNSRLETVTNVLNNTADVDSNQIGRAVGTASQNLVSDTITKSSDISSTIKPTGLLSTIVNTVENSGVKTVLSTDVFGTYIDGLYAKVLESTSSILTSSPSSSSSIGPSSVEKTPLKPTGVVSINQGKIIDADSVSTLYYTTQAVGTYIDNLYAQVIESTSSLNVNEERKAALSTDIPINHRTGLVRLIEGSIVQNDTTTVYQSKVLGTSIDGRYAQIIESTSSFIHGSIKPSSVGDIQATPTKAPDQEITTRSSVSISPSPVVIEGSLSDSSKIDESEESSTEENEEEEDDEDGDKRVKSRLTFQTKKRTFTPVIRPFASRPRSSYAPKRKGSGPATTVTRSDVTPTVTAVPASKPARFGTGRRSSSSSANAIVPTASGSRRFSRPKSSSSSGRRSSSRIQPTATGFGGGSSRRGGFRSSSGGPQRASSLFNQNSRFRIRPTLASGLIRSPNSATPSSVDGNEENDLTTQVTDNPTDGGGDGGDTTLPISTTTEGSSRRSQNPLLRFRRPPLSRPSSAPRSTTQRGKTKTTTTTTPKPRSTFARPNGALGRPRTNALFPRRNLFTTTTTPAPEETEEEDDLDEETENNEDDTDYEGSQTNTQTVSPPTAPPESKKTGVQIKPFFRKRSKRQTSSIYSRFRRPGSRTTAAPVVEEIKEPEPTKASRSNNRYGSRGRKTTQGTTSSPSFANNRKRIQPSKASTQGRSQFTLREKGTTPRSSFRRPSTAKARNSGTVPRPKSPRLRPQHQTESSIRKPTRQSQRTTRRGSTRHRTDAHEINDNLILPQFDGTITVTHQIPTEVTIPVVNGKITEYKNVLTASYSTEILAPRQYSTSLNPFGKEVTVLLSEASTAGENGATLVTQFVLNETPTSSVIFTPTYIRGRKTSYSHVIPSTAYGVEQVINTIQPALAAQAPLANILLSQLLLGGLQPQNPLLGLQNPGLAGTPTTELKTRTTTYVTTVTSQTSTVLPLTFRGKEILTTIIDSSVTVVTATEYLTDTITVTPAVGFPPGGQQLNTLLLPLLQQQLAQSPQPQPQQPAGVFGLPPNIAQNLPQAQALLQEPEKFNLALDEEVEPDLEVLQDEAASEAPTRRNTKSGIRKNKKNKPTPAPVTEPPKETSVITLYVSGRTPGEFSTVLSTFVVGERRKREVTPSRTYDDLVVSTLDYFDTYVAPGTKDLTLDTSDTKVETESLESVVGDVSKYVTTSSLIDTKPTKSTDLSSKKYKIKYVKASGELSRSSEGRAYEEARYNLATRVMSNGVEVIVAGDKSTLPGEPDVKRVLPSSIYKPITLKPSTLRHHVMMLLPQDVSNINSLTEISNQFVTKTCLTTFTYLTTFLESGITTVSSHEQVVSNVATEERNTGKILPTPAVGITLTQYPNLSVGVFHTTYTYLNTILDGEQPLVVTSKHTVTNTVTAPDDYLSLLQPSINVSALKDTNTYYSTIALEKTLYEDETSKILSTNEVVTQVVITESVPPKATSVMTSYIALDISDPDPKNTLNFTTTDVVKTYFVTYTYYNTLVENGETTVKTNISTSSDVVTEKLFLQPKRTAISTNSALKKNKLDDDFVIFATKTYHTTFTYFTTLLQEQNAETPTVVSSRSKIVENVVTETLNPTLLDKKFLNRIKSELTNDEVTLTKLATLSNGEKLEVTVVPLHITPSNVLPIDKTTMPSSKIETTKIEIESSTPDVITGSTIIFLDDEPSTTKKTPSLSTRAKSTTSKKLKTTISTSKTRISHKTKGKIQSSSAIHASKLVSRKPTTKKPENIPDLLGLGSINMNSLQALTPVLNAMAGLIKTNLKSNRRNDSLIPPTTPNSIQEELVLIPDAQNRSPIYIPVGGVANSDEIEVAESQNVATFHLQGVEWDSTNKHEIPLLNGGISISPGEVITANSDVIVGKPGRIMPRIPSIPLNQVKEDEDFGLKPPPPVQHKNRQKQQTQTQAGSVEKPIYHKKPDDYFGPPPPLRTEKHKHIPLRDRNNNGNNRERPQIHHQQQSTYGGGYFTSNQVNSEFRVPTLPVGTNGDLKKNYKEVAAKNPYPIYAENHPQFINNNNPLKDFQPSIVLPEVIERSTGQPLLVNIQPSQVAFVNIPHNRSTALIYGGSSEPHHNGQYFDDPSPYPQPEFSAIESFNNGIPQFASVYHETAQSPDQKEVGGVIRVAPQPVNNLHVEISPSRPNYYQNHEINVNVPPISFGMVQKDDDFNAHIINHGSEFRPPPISYQVQNHDDIVIDLKPPEDYVRQTGDQIVDLVPPTQNNYEIINKPPKRVNHHQSPNNYNYQISEFMSPPPISGTSGNVRVPHRPLSIRPQIPIPLTPEDNRLVPPHNNDQLEEDDDDLTNEDGEVIQESNSRPLRPGQVPHEILKIKTTTTQKPPTQKIRFPTDDNYQSDDKVRPRPVVTRPRPFNNIPFVRPENQLTNQILYDSGIQPGQGFGFVKDVDKIVVSSTTSKPVFLKTRPSTPLVDQNVIFQNNWSEVSTPINNHSLNMVRPPIPIHVVPITTTTSKTLRFTTPKPVRFSYYGTRPKVTSLPIDTQTIRSPGLINNNNKPPRGSQTEKPFKTYSRPSSGLSISDLLKKERVTTQQPPLRGVTDSAVDTSSDLEVMKPPPPSVPNREIQPPKLDHRPTTNPVVPLDDVVFLNRPSAEMTPPPVKPSPDNVIGLKPPAATRKPTTTERTTTLRSSTGTVISRRTKRPTTTTSTTTRRNITPNYEVYGRNRTGTTTSISFGLKEILPSPSTKPPTEVRVSSRKPSTSSTERTTISSTITSSTPEEIVTPPGILAVHHAGNEVKIVDEPTRTRSRFTTSVLTKEPKLTVLPTRYITHTKTATVTITKTTVVKTLGGPPSTFTLLVTKTDKSTIVDTVTEFHTLLQPTSVFETVTTTINHQGGNNLYPPDLYGSTYPSIKIRPSSTVQPVLPTITVEETVIENADDEDLDDFIIKDDEPQVVSDNHPITDNNESIFVVMTDKSKGNVLKMPNDNDSYETHDRDEVLQSNEANNVLLGGIFIASPPSLEVPRSDKCEPDCKASRNELCQKVEGLMRCVCRPGFARMFPDRPCIPTYTYHLQVDLDRIGKDRLEYSDDLDDKNSTEFGKLTKITHEALDRMVMQSDLRDIYHGVQVHSYKPPIKTAGVTTRLYLQLSDNTDEKRLKDVFKKYLRNNNYSLGGTEVFAARESLDDLEAQDFDECTNPKFHDCSENAQCFNLKGTYTCSCKEGFADLSENTLYPGRVCSAELVGCEKCNYHGTCYSRGDDLVLCECFHWYTGETCYINLKVLLIGLVTLGAILVVLLLICLILMCCRKKPQRSQMSRGISFLPQRVTNNSTIDRRAMIEDTSSEDSRSETNTLPYVAEKKNKKLKGALKKTRHNSTVEIETNEGTITFPDQKDRSLTVMIPRAKYHPAPPTSPLINYTSFDARKPSVPSTSNEAKLLSYLDAGPSPTNSVNKRKCSNDHSDSYLENAAGSRKTSGALISAGFEVSATVLGNNMGTLGTTGGTEADRSENATLIHKISADLLSSTGTRSQFNTLRKSLVDDDIDPMSNWMSISNRVTTLSDARSYDETTIPPPMKSFRNGYDSKPSSQHQNDEANTMAERDLGSTFLLPHTHLYKPDRGSDISGFESL